MYCFVRVCVCREESGVEREQKRAAAAAFFFLLPNQSVFFFSFFLLSSTHSLGIIVQIDGVERQEVGRDKGPDEHRYVSGGKRERPGDSMPLFSLFFDGKKKSETSLPLFFFFSFFVRRARGGHRSLVFSSLTHNLSAQSASSVHSAGGYRETVLALEQQQHLERPARDGTFGTKKERRNRRRHGEQTTATKKLWALPQSRRLPLHPRAFLPRLLRSRMSP